MSHPELLLSNQLCFLVYRLDRMIAARYRPLLAELGLTYPQYLVLLVLWEKDGCGVGELCSALDLDTGTVSPLVKRLEAAGLVERRRSAGDERAVRVSLTSAGRALEDRARAVPGAVGGCIVSGPEDYANIQGMLRGLIKRMEGGCADEEPVVAGV